jgi:hypothetical protein
MRCAASGAKIVAFKPAETVRNILQSETMLFEEARGEFTGSYRIRQ